MDAHRSHQNGLEVDVHYPRLDSVRRAPRTTGQIDRRLAQDLVDRFVAAGAQMIFVGICVPPELDLPGHLRDASSSGRARIRAARHTWGYDRDDARGAPLGAQELGFQVPPSTLETAARWN